MLSSQKSLIGCWAHRSRCSDVELTEVPVRMLSSQKSLFGCWAHRSCCLDAELREVAVRMLSSQKSLFGCWAHRRRCSDAELTKVAVRMLSSQNSLFGYWAHRGRCSAASGSTWKFSLCMQLSINLRRNFFAIRWYWRNIIMWNKCTFVMLLSCSFQHESFLLYLFAASDKNPKKIIL